MLYKETVEPTTLGLLTELSNLPELRQFRLVGGTALSLFYGHRASIDLDFFTDEPFDIDLISNSLSKKYPSFIAQEIKGTRLFFTTINNVKVDFVHTFEPFIFSDQLVENIRFAAVEDIIALKLNAITGRGKKKDFWDIHELLNYYSFEQLMDFYHQKYPQNSPMMILKSIPYFVNADEDEDPYCFKQQNWETVKKNILEKFNKYIKS